MSLYCCFSLPSCISFLTSRDIKATKNTKPALKRDDVSFYETNSRNNRYYPHFTGLYQEWNYVYNVSKVVPSYYQWSFDPSSLTVLLQASVVSTKGQQSPDNIIGLSTREGIVRFSSSVSSLQSGAKLMGTIGQKIWFFGKHITSNHYYIQSISTLNGQQVDLFQFPRDMTTSSPSICFSSYNFYVIDGNSIFYYAYNHNRNIFILSWVKENFPKVLLGSECNIVFNYSLIYISNDGTNNHANIVTTNGLLYWGNNPQNNIDVTVFSPAFDRSYYFTYYLAGEGVYYVIDSKGVGTAYSDKNRKDITYNRFVVSLSGDAIGTNGKNSIFSLGNSNWNYTSDYSNDEYQIIIDDQKQEVICFSTTRGTLVLSLLDGSFIKSNNMNYRGEDSALFADSQLFLSSDNKVPMITGLKRS